MCRILGDVECVLAGYEMFKEVFVGRIPTTDLPSYIHNFIHKNVVQNSQSEQLM
jgi:hypothetical protein